ncbi:ABC transporter permease [Mesorhizobium tamadayense]|uniref:ABC transporter permease n=1 Tax=Mesorhizobium tamadayense TaxID=425306 RepID=A0A3P3F7D3_9HYPH|nr:ABC transporter permease [Mesorhizobium tamadayense]RRH94112.1 ABC transporter permease [Mesorhizobium tamadayense]
MLATDVKSPTMSPQFHLSSPLARFMPPVLVVIGSLILWEFGSEWFELPKYLLPAPSEFMNRFVTDRGVLAYNFSATAYVVILGFAIATAIAIPLGLAIASYPSLNHNLFPLIVFFETIPKTITAPLFVVWLGFGLSPRIALTAVMTFFPILLNSIAGFSAINPRLNYITRSMGATPWQSFRFVRFPSAMPIIFAGMKMGMVYAVTGCVTAEFVGANEGLAALILQAADYMDVQLMFAAIFATAMLGMLLTGILLGVERWLMPWRRDL